MRRMSLLRSLRSLEEVGHGLGNFISGKFVEAKRTEHSVKRRRLRADRWAAPKSAALRLPARPFGVFATVTLLALSLAAASCAPPAAQADEPVKDWIVVDQRVDYVPLPDVNPEKTRQATLGFEIAGRTRTWTETADGVLIALMDGKKPLVRKASFAGEVVWERRYPCEIPSGTLNNIVATPDGGFAFTVQAWPFASGQSERAEDVPKSLVVKCDAGGREEWRRDLEDHSGSVAEMLLSSGEGRLALVGEWNAKGGRQVREGGTRDIVVTVLEPNGAVVGRRSIGGSEEEQLYRAAFGEKTGLVIFGWTWSRDGDFAGAMLAAEGHPALEEPAAQESAMQEPAVEQTGGLPAATYFVACLRPEMCPDLPLRWLRLAEPGEAYEEMAVGDDAVYLLGSRRAGPREVGDGREQGGGQEEGQDQRSGLLTKLDTEGHALWTAAGRYSGFWGRALAVLDRGRVVAAAGVRYEGAIMVLDPSGTIVARLDGLRMIPDAIVPTRDGGFIVTALRDIRPVPQPPFVSSIWMDTECVAEKRGPDLALEWRKTYDRYKGDRRPDIILPLSTGRLLIAR